jgi:hypothetical protein
LEPPSPTFPQRARQPRLRHIPRRPCRKSHLPIFSQRGGIGIREDTNTVLLPPNTAPLCPVPRTLHPVPCF